MVIVVNSRNTETNYEAVKTTPKKKREKNKPPKESSKINLHISYPIRIPAAQIRSEGFGTIEHPRHISHAAGIPGAQIR